MKKSTAFNFCSIDFNFFDKVFILHETVCQSRSSNENNVESSSILAEYQLIENVIASGFKHLTVKWISPFFKSHLIIAV